jgi:hypothetical protein
VLRADDLRLNQLADDQQPQLEAEHVRPDLAHGVLPFFVNVRISIAPFCRESGRAKNIPSAPVAQGTLGRTVHSFFKWRCVRSGVPEMAVNLLRVNVLVICAAVLQANVPPKSGVPAVLDVTTNPEAYEVYAAALEQPGLWPSKDALLLRQETSTDDPCSGFGKKTTEWAEVAQDFQRQNTVEWLLQPALPINRQYSFIRESEIDAELAIARLRAGGSAGVYPLTEHVTVSSVGFNRERTKAMVVVRRWHSATTEKWELKDGKWQRAGYVCHVDIN